MTTWTCEACGSDVLDALRGCERCINEAHAEAEIGRLRGACGAALGALRRLSFPDEMAGMGDASEPPNNTPEMRARMSYAREQADRVAAMARGEI